MLGKSWIGGLLSNTHRTKRRLAVRPGQHGSATIEAVEARMMLAGDVIAVTDTPEANDAGGVVLNNSQSDGLTHGIATPNRTFSAIQKMASANLIIQSNGKALFTVDLGNGFRAAYDPRSFHVSGDGRVVVELQDDQFLDLNAAGDFDALDWTTLLPVEVNIVRLPLELPDSAPSIVAEESTAIDLAQVIGNPARLRQLDLQADIRGVAQTGQPSGDQFDLEPVQRSSIEGAMGRARSLEVAATVAELPVKLGANANEGPLEAELAFVHTVAPRYSTNFALASASNEIPAEIERDKTGAAAFESPPAVASVSAAGSWESPITAASMEESAKDAGAILGEEELLAAGRDTDPTLIDAALVELSQHWELSSLVLATGIISGYRYVEHPENAPQRSVLGRKLPGKRRRGTDYQE